MLRSRKWARQSGPEWTGGQPRQRAGVKPEPTSMDASRAESSSQFPQGHTGSTHRFRAAQVVMLKGLLGISGVNKTATRSPPPRRAGASCLPLAGAESYKVVRVPVPRQDDPRTSFTRSAQGLTWRRRHGFARKRAARCPPHPVAIHHVRVACRKAGRVRTGAGVPPRHERCRNGNPGCHDEFAADCGPDATASPRGSDTSRFQGGNRLQPHLSRSRKGPARPSAHRMAGP